MAGLFGAPRRLPPIDPALGAMMMREAGVGQPLQQQMPTPSPQPKKPAFFGQGGTGRAIAGSLGDALLQMNGASAIYAPNVQHQQAMQRQQQLALQQRQWGREDKLWEWQNKPETPREPDAFERALAGANIDPTSQQGQQLFRARAESMARDPMDEYVVVPIPGVGTYAGPRSGLGEVMGGQRPRRLGPIVNEIPGGPTPQASGGFRP